MTSGTVENAEISNPVTGVRIREPPADAPEGSADVHLDPGASGPPEHVHPDTEERFEVLDGDVVFRVDGRERTLEPGTTIRVAPGTAHTFRNDEDGDAAFRVRTLPANEQLGKVVATLFGLAQEGDTDPQGRPGVLQGAVMAAETIDDVYFTDVPYPVQRAVGTTLGPVGRALGYSATYERFLDEAYWQDR